MICAPEVITEALQKLPVEDHAAFLKSLLAYTAGGLVALVGDRAASEALYKVADAVVTRLK